MAVYSMATSSAADAPRGMGFLYALDGLNVATSRRQEMRMDNALVRFGEMAGEGTGRPTLLSQGAWQYRACQRDSPPEAHLGVGFFDRSFKP